MSERVAEVLTLECSFLGDFSRNFGLRVAMGQDPNLQNGSKRREIISQRPFPR
jgi:hypothetical protein